MTEYLVTNRDGSWSSATLPNNPTRQDAPVQIYHHTGKVESLPYDSALSVLLYCQSKPEQYTVTIVE